MFRRLRRKKARINSRSVLAQSRIAMAITIVEEF
jgi:hypothetical protein